MKKTATDFFSIISRCIGYSGFYIFSKMDFRFFLPVFAEIIEITRVFFLKMAGAKIGKKSFVRSQGYIAFARNLEIGDRSKINRASKLFLFEKLVIGNDVEIGPEFLVYNAEHKIENPQLPLTKQGSYAEPIFIGNDVYIGARVTILKGAYIEDRVIVAAGAVVRGRLSSGGIYGGIPARKISDIPS